jgi:Flp pilus assembly pilin Flp
MEGVKKFVRSLLRDESGISSVEYALLLAFVAGGIIIAAGELSTAIQGEMSAAADCIDGTTAAASC